MTIAFSNIWTLISLAKLTIQPHTSATEPTPFNNKTKELLAQLTEEASVSPELYAAGQLKLGLGESETIYGMTQCTRDHFSADCKKFLYDAIGQLPNCCDGKEGAWKSC